jgi:hypothetical protein
MTEPAETACRDCGKPLGGGIFQKSETRVLGMAFCEDCVRSRTLFCHACRASLSSEDFAQGKAVTLLGRRFCENCLESAVKEGRDKAARNPGTRRASPSTIRRAADELQSDDTIAIRRLYGRFVPHAEAVLVVKRPGLWGALRGNLARLWLDVSEGGYRAILAGALELETRLAGSITFKPSKESFPFASVVKHARPSQRYPGCVLAGVKFEKPSRELQAFIRSQMGGRPVMIPSPGAKSSDGPSSTTLPPVRPSTA